ncbi:MAG: acyl-CoA dehydrogenase family protein, partial [Acidobacteriota bacterium]
MDFSWGSELEAIRAEAERLCARFDDDYWSGCDEKHEFPWEFYRAFAEGGWLGILVPEAYGGSGLGTLHAGALLNAVAASAGAQNAASALHISIFGMAPVI